MCSLQFRRLSGLCALWLGFSLFVAEASATTNLPGSVSGGTGALADIQSNDLSSYSIAKGASGNISGFSAFGGTITSVYLFVEYVVDAGYDGTNALQVNSIDTSIVPKDGERVQQRFIELSAGPFNVDTSGEITSLSIDFHNSDSGGGDSVHFDYAYLVINPQLPIHMPPTWSDEFGGTGEANPATWWYEEGYQRNNEDQYYQTGALNGVQTNGMFRIEGREETVGGYNYTSASIRSQGNYSWMYGRAQIRAKLPCVVGLWPAIWMVGDTGEWPSNGECDIMEWYANKTLSNCARGTTTRWTAAWDSANMTMTYAEAIDPGWRTNFHVWTIQWDQQNVRLYCDNKLMNTTSQSWLVNPTTQWGPLEPFKQPHSLWLNLAIGGNAGGNPANPSYPVYYFVDYWRVWEGATNNVAPTDIVLETNSISEGLPAGTVVSELNIVDSDPAEVIRYSLVTGTGDDDNAQFSIPEFVSDSTTMGHLKTAAVLDYTDGPTRSIRVRATDIEGATYTKVLTISVIPTPAIDISTNTITVAEGSTTDFQVKLRIPPVNTVTVNVSRVSGDTDLSVSSVIPLIFTAANATNWTTVTIAAAEDADWTNGAAIFECSDPEAGYNPAMVTAYESENDNDAPIVSAGADQIIAIGASSPWTPAYTNTTAWYDASDTGSIIESAGLVSQWNDKSGNGRHIVQGTGSLQPVYGATSWDGVLPALTFDGVDDYLEYATRETEGVVTLAVVLEQANTSRDDRAFGVRGVSGATVNFAIASDNSLRYDGNNSSANMVPASIGKHMRVAMRGTTAQTDFHDGSSNLVSSLSLPNMDGYLNVGNVSPSHIGAFTSKIAEGIVIYNAIDESLRTKLEGYLAHKWGLDGNLPSNHVFKASAPTDAAAVTILNGVVSDPNGDPVSILWTVVSGPVGTVFDDASAASTTVTFVHPGVYVLRLTAADHLEETYDEVTVFVGEDADSDGMHDDWETTHFGNTTTSDGANDQDGDGMLDLHEFLAGTVPTNSDSLLMINSVAPLAGNAYQMSWQSVQDKTYHVLFKTNLTDSIWLTNLSGVVGQDQSTTITNSFTAPKGFFILRLE